MKEKIGHIGEARNANGRGAAHRIEWKCNTWHAAGGHPAESNGSIRVSEDWMWSLNRKCSVEWGSFWKTAVLKSKWSVKWNWSSQIALGCWRKKHERWICEGGGKGKLKLKWKNI